MSPSEFHESRRAFLRRAATTSGALALGSALAGQASSNRTQTQPKQPVGVELAVATICADGFANHRHEPAFEIIPKTGFSAVEFNIWYPELLAPSYIESIVNRCSKTGLRPVCVQGTSFGGEGNNAVMNDVGHKVWLMEYAKRLGCRRVKCTGSRRGTNGGLDHVIEVCRELAPIAEELDVLLLLENHARNVLELPEDYETIFEAIDSAHVGMCLDTGHFEGVGVHLDTVLDRFRSRIQHVDLKDCAAFGEGHNTVVFGEGVTDFDPFLNDLIDGGYTGYLVIEMAWSKPRPPVVENLIAAREQFLPYTRS